MRMTDRSEFVATVAMNILAQNAMNSQGEFHQSPVVCDRAILLANLFADRLEAAEDKPGLVAAARRSLEISQGKLEQANSEIEAMRRAAAGTEKTIADLRAELDASKDVSVKAAKERDAALKSLEDAKATAAAAMAAAAAVAPDGKKAK